MIMDSASLVCVIVHWPLLLILFIIISVIYYYSRDIHFNGCPSSVHAQSCFFCYQNEAMFTNNGQEFVKQINQNWLSLLCHNMYHIFLWQ